MAASAEQNPLSNDRSSWKSFLDDPYSTFVLGIILCVVLSFILSGQRCDIRGSIPGSSSLRVENQFTSRALISLMSSSVKTFVEFPPLGIVLIALMGVSVAQKSGCLVAMMRVLVNWCPKRYLTPLIAIIGLLSRTGADSGYIIVPPFAAIVFASVGRHPIAGIATAFVAVSASIGANVIPAAIDPLLQVFTEKAAHQVVPTYMVSPLCNYFFSLVSACLTVCICWYVTDRIVEPMLTREVPFVATATVQDMPAISDLATVERGALWKSMIATLLFGLVLTFWVYHSTAAWRYPGRTLTDGSAPLMQSLVPMIFCFFMVPGTVYGFSTGVFKAPRDVFRSMMDGISEAGGFIVLCLFASLLTNVISESHLGTFVASRFAELISSWSLPLIISTTIVFVVVILLNLIIPSASAKWAIIAPLFVPVLMQSGQGPEGTQALYRAATASTSSVSPFLPYIPILMAAMTKFIGDGANYKLLRRCAIRYVWLLATFWYVLFVIWVIFRLPFGIT